MTEPTPQATPTDAKPKRTRRAKTLTAAEELALIDKEQAQLNARRQKAKAVLADEERKRETRRKLLRGVALEAMCATDPRLAQHVTAYIEKHFSDSDKAFLRNCPPLYTPPAEKPQAAPLPSPPVEQKSETHPAPAAPPRPSRFDRIEGRTT